MNNTLLEQYLNQVNIQYNAKFCFYDVYDVCMSDTIPGGCATAMIPCICIFPCAYTCCTGQPCCCGSL